MSKRALPHCAQTRWNFQSRVVRSVKQNHQELLAYFLEIKSSPKRDDIAIVEAQGLTRLLIDFEFCFFLDFFADIFVQVDVQHNAFQSHIRTALLLSLMHPSFAILFSKSDRTDHLKATKSLCAAAN